MAKIEYLSYLNSIYIQLDSLIVIIDFTFIMTIILKWKLDLVKHVIRNIYNFI